MISNHIQDLITAAKAQPNGLWRNKTISALQSAYAASKMQEWEKTPLSTQTGLESPANGQLAHVCVCPAIGVIDIKCPEHGGML